jgi:hypothetical protein
MDNKPSAVDETQTGPPQPIIEEKPRVDAGPPIISPPNPPKSRRVLLTTAAVVVVLLLTGLGWWHFGHHKSNSDLSATNTGTHSKITSSSSASKAPNVQGLQLNQNKNYGNKYADGILPVGDGKYTSKGPKQGYIYACTQYAQNLETQNGGAMTRGPWFTDDNKEYNVNKKLHVEGSVMWSAQFTDTLNGNSRTIVTNDLPSQPTGIFPIMSTDPAYQYDHNPNSIKGQKFTFNLAADPSYYANPNCETGEVGIMLTGVVLFSGLDAGGRDAGAWEVQDSCDGHPQMDGIYHYHTLSSCIKNVSVHTVIGYGLDGFPITGPVIGTNNILTTSDLDECHGIVSPINLDGKTVTMYHYVMTQDYPYSISCFRGKPITPPGQQQQLEQSQQAGSGQLPPPPRP